MTLSALTSPRIPIKFPEHIFSALSKFWFAHPRPLDGREAGENPALPRNCKRGNPRPVTGETWEGRPQKSDVVDVLTRKPGDRREPSTTNPFRVSKEECMRFFARFSFLRFLSAGGGVRCRSQNQSRGSPIRGRRPGRKCLVSRRCSRLRSVVRPLPPKAWRLSTELPLVRTACRYWPQASRPKH